jgi:hypothetical protein
MPSTEGTLDSLRPDIAESLTLLGVGYPAGIAAAHELDLRRSGEVDEDEVWVLRGQVDPLEDDLAKANDAITQLTRERDDARAEVKALTS